MITKKQAKKKVRELLKDDFAAMKKCIDKALDSGAIDFTDFDDDYELPRIIISAIYKQHLYQRMPLQEKRIKEVDNLYNFI